MATGETEKDIFDKSLRYDMGNEAKKPKDASLGYENPLDKVGTKSLSFKKYLEILNQNIRKPTYQSPHEHEITDAFLRRHTGASYEEFTRLSGFKNLRLDRYGKVSLSQRRALFKKEFGMHMHALEAAENEGYDVMGLFRNNKVADYPKKMLNEPVFGSLLLFFDMVEKRRNGAMANLFRRAYSGNISPEDLRNEGYKIIDEVMSSDPRGYERSGTYPAIKRARRFLDDLHDQFTIDALRRDKRELLNLADKLSE